MNPHSPLRSLAAGLLAALVLYFCFFYGLGSVGLIGPDEPRYAWIAREMAAGANWKDWITPRLYGTPWFEKPPLLYWAAAVSFRALGASEFAARLPSALAALLAALAIAWAARRRYGWATAWATLLIFPTSIGVFGFARAVATDMLFSSALTLAMLAASEIVLPAASAARDSSTASPSQARLPALVTFGATLGLAALGKGPAAIVLAGGSVGVWALVTRRWRPALRLFHLAAVISFAAVALPWYILCARLNPGFAKNFLLLHNVERYLTPVFQHVKPFWFFGPIVLLGLIPWTALLIVPARDAGAWYQPRQAPAWRDSPSLFFACWAAFPLVFFSFSQSKLPGYVLPVFPPLALLAARSLGRSIHRNEAPARWALAAVGATWVALALSSGYWLKQLPADFVSSNFQTLVNWLSSIVALGALIAALGLLKRPWAALSLSAMLMTALIAEVNHRFLPRLDSYLSARASARRALAAPGASGRFYVLGLSRAWEFGLSFYLRQEVLKLTLPSSAIMASPAESPEALSGAAVGVFTNPAGVAELARNRWKVAVVGHVSPLVLLVTASREVHQPRAEPPAHSAPHHKLGAPPRGP